MTTLERCSMLHPPLHDIKGMDTFLSSCDHLGFEQYDLDNNTDGFETMVKEGKLECMIAHRRLTTFEWNNFDARILFCNGRR